MKKKTKKREFQLEILEKTKIKRNFKKNCLFIDLPIYEYFLRLNASTRNGHIQFCLENVCKEI